MPNWCGNDLMITGEKALLEKFLVENAHLDSNGTPIIGTISFARTVPEINKHDSQEWYWWRIQKWGTKWDNSPDENFLHFVDDQTLSGGFETAWAPPQPWLETVSEKYPDLKFELEYEEPGCDFAGIFGIHGGSIIRDEQWSLNDKITEEGNAFFAKWIAQYPALFSPSSYVNDFDSRLEEVFQMRLDENSLLEKLDRDLHLEVDRADYKWLDLDSLKESFSEWFFEEVVDNYKKKRILENPEFPEGKKQCVRE